jgi:hypothetical protein
MSCYINPEGVLGFDALLPYVNPYVRGAPPEIMLHHIRLSTIEFCRRSGILHDINQYYLQAYTQDYQLTTDCNYDIVRVVRVTVDKRWNYSPVNVKLPGGVGAYLYHMTSPTILHLRRPPAIDNPNGLEVETAVAPKQDSCVLDNYLYEMWAEGIAAGAISRLLSIPQTNWFDRQSLADFALKFRKELTRCRAEIDRAFAPGGLMKTEQWIGPGNRGWGTGGGYWGGGRC